MPVERIKLEVEVRINYDNESERKAKLLSPDSK